MVFLKNILNNLEVTKRLLFVKIVIMPKEQTRKTHVSIVNVIVSVSEEGTRK